MPLSVQLLIVKMKLNTVIKMQINNDNSEMSSSQNVNKQDKLQVYICEKKALQSTQPLQLSFQYQNMFCLYSFIVLDVQQFHCTIIVTGRLYETFEPIIFVVNCLTQYATISYTAARHKNYLVLFHDFLM